MMKTDMFVRLTVQYTYRNNPMFSDAKNKYFGEK